MLRESEEKTRSMLDTSLDAIITMDGEGPISYFNKAAEKMFGFRQKEVKKKKLHDLLVSENAQKKYVQNLPRFEQSGQCQIIGKTLEFICLKKRRDPVPCRNLGLFVSSSGKVAFCRRNQGHHHAQRDGNKTSRIIQDR